MAMVTQGGIPPASLLCEGIFPPGIPGNGAAMAQAIAKVFARPNSVGGSGAVMREKGETHTARKSAGTGQKEEELSRRVLRRLASLQTERRSWEGHWKQLAEHFLPRKSRFLSDRANAGTRSGTRLYDSTGVLAARTLASGMQGGLTSPAMPWFRLGFREPAMEATDAGRVWLHDTQERMTAAFARSNFYEQIHTLYAELAVMGTACMLVEECADREIRFRTLTAGEYFLAENASGLVDTLYLRLPLTVGQIVERWPHAPAWLQDAAGRDDGTRHSVLHAIEPRKNWVQGSARKEERPFASIFLLETGGAVLEHGGYYEFPAVCPRWDVTGGDVYGRSPAMDALADCRMLQRIRRDTLQALSREVRPPLNVTSGALSVVPDVSPDAINYIPVSGQGEAVTPLYQVRANLQAAEATIQGFRTQIKEAFFNDLFMLFTNASKVMTAREVAERNAEKMLMLGPALDRLRSEVFSPLVERVYSLMHRSGLLAPEQFVPEQFVPGQFVPGQPALEILQTSSGSAPAMKVEFVSLLAQAQKASGIAAVSGVIDFTCKLAAINAEVLDKVDTDKALDEMATMTGVPPGLIRSRQHVALLREQKQQTQARQAEMANFKEGVGLATDAAKALKEAGINPANVVANLLPADGAGQANSTP